MGPEDGDPEGGRSVGEEKRKLQASRTPASRAGEGVLAGVGGKPAWTCAQVDAGDEGES